jgi:hypothetical protein
VRVWLTALVGDPTALVDWSGELRLLQASQGLAPVAFGRWPTLAQKQKEGYTLLFRPLSPARRHDRRLGAIMIEMSRQIGERFAGIYGEQIETNECCRNVCAWNVPVCAKSGRKVLLRLLRRSLSARRRAAMRMWARGLRSRTADR